MNARMALATLSLLTGLCAWSADNLVYNGDFELLPAASPPTGWTMWGAEKYKVPANYTRDTTVRHGDEASFRLHHPADTSGYIVSSSDHAIRPKMGQRYTVSFYARSDRKGSSAFGIMAYESIAPFKDAPSPGRWPLAVDPEWQRYEFSVDEGWDFFADHSKYLLLTFYPTQNNKEARTLWVDDVVVTSSPSPRKGRLVDASRLTYQPLQHRLEPGKSLDCVIDARKRLGRTTTTVGGISFHRVAGWTGHPYNKAGEYTLPKETERAIRDLHLPMTRFYAVGDEPFSLEDSLDRAASVCGKIDVPLRRCVLEFEVQGARSKLSPEVWARGVAYSVKKGYGFHEWEISNEPYITRADSAFPTPDDYVAHVQAVSKAIRAVDPQARIGIGINKRSQNWGNYILKQTAGCYDFVAAHHYSSVKSIHKSKFEAVALTANYQALDRCLRTNALLRAYNPHRPVVQLDTEWGLHCGGPNGERADNVDRNANIFGTLHRAVRLIYYAREGMLAGASAWQMLNRVSGQGFAILFPRAPDKRSMLYWLYYYFNRHLGEYALDIQGTTPYYAPAAGDCPSFKAGEYPGPQTPVLATLTEDGKTLYLVIANGSWDQPTPCRIQLRNLPMSHTDGILLTQDDPDGKPLLQRKEDAISSFSASVTNNVLTCTIPPHAVVFLTVR
jgi:hypothetical protein